MNRLKYQSQVNQQYNQILAEKSTNSCSFSFVNTQLWRFNLPSLGSPDQFLRNAVTSKGEMISNRPYLSQTTAKNSPFWQESSWVRPSRTIRQQSTIRKMEHTQRVFQNCTMPLVLPYQRYSRRVAALSTESTACTSPTMAKSTLSHLVLVSQRKNQRMLDPKWRNLRTMKRLLTMVTSTESWKMSAERERARQAGWETWQPVSERVLLMPPKMQMKLRMRWQMQKTQYSIFLKEPLRQKYTSEKTSIIRLSTRQISISDRNDMNGSMHDYYSELREICQAVTVAISPRIIDFKETNAIETVLDWGTLMANSILIYYYHKGASLGSKAIQFW